MTISPPTVPADLAPIRAAGRRRRRPRSARGTGDHPPVPDRRATPSGRSRPMSRARAGGSRRPRQRRRFARWAVALGAAAVVAASVWLVGFSPVFAADSVEVSGTSPARSADAVMAAGVPLGLPLVRLDTTATAARVAALPWVESAHVVRHVFGTVEIAVTERKAVLALVRPGGYGLVDSSGLLFDDAAELPAGLLPVTVSPPDDRLLAGAATVVAALPDVVRSQATGLAVTSADHFEFTLTSGATLFWGSAEQSGLKAEAARALLTTAARSYDVSAPAYPAARP